MPGKGDSSVLVWKLLTEGQFQTLQIYLWRLVAGEDRWEENGEGGRLGVGWKKQSFASVTTSSSPQASPKASSPRQLQKLKQLLHHHRTQIAQPPSLSSSWWFSSWVFILYPSNTEVFLYSLTKFDGLGGWFHYWGLKFWVLSSINWLMFWGSLSNFFVWFDLGCGLVYVTKSLLSKVVGARRIWLIRRGYI